ncbi:MAG: cell division protein SepF [Conexivisphaera sp.]
MSGTEGKHAEEQRVLYYVTSYSIRSEEDVRKVKEDVRNNFIVILRITPLLEKGREITIKVINQIYEYVISMGGDMARLGEDRIVLTPPGVRIWREMGP